MPVGKWDPNTQTWVESYPNTFSETRKDPRPGKFVVLAVLGLLLASALIGRFTAPGGGSVGWRDGAIESVSNGCLPVTLVIAPAPEGGQAELQVALDRSLIELNKQYGDISGAETKIVPVPPNGAVATKYKGAAYLGVIQLERCLDDSVSPVSTG